MAKLGSVTIFNEQESKDTNVNITEYNVEDGASFADHVRSKHPTFHVSGFIFGNVVTAVNKLEENMNKGKRLRYVGRLVTYGVLIESISTKYTKNVANGCAITLTLRKVKITQTPYVEAPPKEVPIRKPVTNEGQKKPEGKKESPNKYHTVKSGDTYWSCAQKYGVSIKQLQTWNPWPDTKIPVGGKMRVG